MSTTNRSTHRRFTPPGALLLMLVVLIAGLPGVATASVWSRLLTTAPGGPLGESPSYRWVGVKDEAPKGNTWKPADPDSLTPDERSGLADLLIASPGCLLPTRLRCRLRDNERISPSSDRVVARIWTFSAHLPVEGQTPNGLVPRPECLVQVCRGRQPPA